MSTPRDFRDYFRSPAQQDITQPTTVDLSHLVPGDPVSGLCPTSQGAGNQVSDNSHAGTAPGGPPSTPFTSLHDEVIDHPAPEISALHHDRAVVVNADGSKAGGQS